MNLNQAEKNIYKIADGDKSALKYIYDEFHYVVYNLALSILHNPQYAEDVSQEVFLKIWKNAHNFCPEKNLKAWIIEITKNQSIDFLRKKKNEVIIEDFDKINKCNENLDEQVIDKVFLEQLLFILPEINREIFIMHAIGGFTYKEISKILKMSIGKVFWNYKSSIKILTNHIKQYKF